MVVRPFPLSRCFPCQVASQRAQESIGQYRRLPPHAGKQRVCQPPNSLVMACAFLPVVQTLLHQRSCAQRRNRNPQRCLCLRLTTFAPAATSNLGFEETYLKKYRRKRPSIEPHGRSWSRARGGRSVREARGVSSFSNLHKRENLCHYILVEADAAHDQLGARERPCLVS